MTRALTIAIAVLLFSASCGSADTGYLPLWQVDGERNRVFLLASVHLLRPADYPLPDAIHTAYDEAEVILMELDLDDLEPAAASELATELGVIRDRETLATLLGTEAYARAAAMASAASLPLDSLSKTEPWLAAITLEQLLLTRVGFDPALGVENQLLQRAVNDGKEILGLETLREQLEMLDQLPLAVQSSLLLSTLEESGEIEVVMNKLIAAWRSGDTSTLEATVLHDMRQQPLLYSELVVDRNQNWASQIEALLRANDDYLVVVGALHLVGKDGVPALLRDRGYTARQLETVSPATTR